MSESVGTEPSPGTTVNKSTKNGRMEQCYLTGPWKPPHAPSRNNRGCVTDICLSPRVQTTWLQRHQSIAWSCLFSENTSSDIPSHTFQENRQKNNNKSMLWPREEFLNLASDCLVRTYSPVSGFTSLLNQLLIQARSSNLLCPHLPPHPPPTLISALEINQAQRRGLVISQTIHSPNSNLQF